MVIRVYISGNSGNKEIVTHQQRIFMILNSLGIPNEPVDISAPGMEKERDFMREKCKKKEGQRHALPPQIFNGEEYRGNFDDFDVANEDDVLEEFLGIQKKDPAGTTPTTTTTTDQPKPATDQPSADKLGEEAMVTDESDKKESSPPPQEAQPPPPIAKPAPEPAADHEHKAEEPPAKPEGELTTTFVEPVKTPEPEQEVIEEEEEAEEEEAEIVDGAAASKLLLAPQEVPETPPKKPVAPTDSDSEEESDEEEVVIPAKKPVDPPIPTKPVEKIICPGTDEYDAMMRKITQESEENNLGVVQDIPALGPSLLPEEVPMPDKKPAKLVIEIDEAKANAGFQNIMNAGRFWKASQLIGTP